jgi:hypothetical protein
MAKNIYLIRGRDSEPYATFKDRIISTAYSISGRYEIVKLTLTEKPPPFFSVIPYKRSRIAVISVYGGPEMIPEPTLVEMEGFAGLYKVTEALPVSYDKTWKDGEVTPGVCLLTLFRKKKNLEYEKFIDRWHNGHTPLSLRIHPLWHYNRNVVALALTNQSEKFDGIVEEHCRTRAELFNPFKFFGNPLIVVPRMLHVYIDVKSFLDYSSIESFVVSEYFLKS